MTKAEFKKQLKTLTEQMMLENVGFKNYTDYVENIGEFEDCQTEEEEAQYQNQQDKVGELVNWLEETLSKCDYMH
jgi:hypothetical protein